QRRCPRLKNHPQIPPKSPAACPTCDVFSSRVHSHYSRVLADLPWQGTPVQLHLEARRFFCDNSSCFRRIFVERLPKVGDVHARKTARLVETLCSIGFALGGEGGSRLADLLGMRSSADTLLRLIRHAPETVWPTAEVLGVDDWAWRRGCRYGTILCDLEKRRPVDLLPDRSSDVLAKWLKTHPNIRVIGRDRGGYYAEGAKKGAPQAVQVADRWHLLHNLREALVRILDRHYRDLREVAEGLAAAEAQRKEPCMEPPDKGGSPYSTRDQKITQVRRARRLERYRRVVELHRQGVSHRAIGRRLGLHRRTVAKYLRAGTFPERAGRSYVSLADPFGDVIRQRWEQGCHNAAELARELKAMGF
ncbi:MAG: ISL3 family transposase, partial [Phycisphaerae bacterium]